MEPLPEAQDEWLDHVQEVSVGTPYTAPSCNSWYVGANIPGKPRVFMPLPGFPQYVAKCDEVVEKGYEGFTFSRAGVEPAPVGA